MILNLYSIVYLFSTVLIGVLSVILAVSSLRAYVSLKRQRALSDHLQARGYLLLHIAQVILVAEAFTLPLFYMTLQSFVSYIQGAMCIFGVTQAQGRLSGIVQILKISIFFSIGWWLLLDRLDSRTESSPLYRRKTFFLFFISTLMVLDSLLQVYYIAGFDVEVDVACCTTVFDLADRKTSVISTSLLGENYQTGLYLIYYLSNLIFMVLLWLSCRSASRRKNLSLLLSIASVFAIVNAFITVVAYFEIIAPDIMNIPEHHCIYCMWQYSPLSVLFTFLFMLGTFMPLWALLLYVSGRHLETHRHLIPLITRLTLAGIGFVGTAIVLQTALM